MAITAVRNQDGEGLRIKVSGRFDFSQHQAFKNCYSQVDPEKTSFTIDLAETTQMDSAALGMLLVLRECAGGMYSDITLSGFNHTIGQILEISRFENLFKFNSSRAARSAYGRRQYGS